MTTGFVNVTRPLLVFDGASWFLRQVRSVEHGVTGEWTYRCDVPLGGSFPTLREGVAALELTWLNMKDSALKQKRYEIRRAAGTCVRCGRRPARPARTRCVVCGRKDAARARKSGSRSCIPEPNLPRFVVPEGGYPCTPRPKAGRA